eukprot:TRINITY_DN7333_c0_g1_i1.p1 TRINITY_DN7333_c0_g1~~TRINITY_DN7333_c0_g1_i1.p1  ORF type:complete len:444 (-),score=5.68 TRINITY_DN7333_c0_g1_i1:112-1266(-)
MSLYNWDLFVRIFGATIGWASVSCSLFVVYSWIKSKKSRSQYSLQLVGILALCDIIMELGIGTDHLFSLANGLFWAEEESMKGFCTYLGIVFYLGFTLTCLWTWCISANLAYIIFQPLRSRPKRIPIKWFLVITLGLSSFVIIIVGSLGGFGLVKTGDTQFCLLTNDQPILYVIFGVVPAVLIWLSMCGIYTAVIVRLYLLFFRDNNINEESKKQYISVIQKSIVFPLIFLLIWLPPFIWGILFYSGSPTRTLLFFDTFSVNMSGILNTTGYMFASKLISYFRGFGFTSKSGSSYPSSSTQSNTSRSSIRLPSSASLPTLDSNPSLVQKTERVNEIETKNTTANPESKIDKVCVTGNDGPGASNTESTTNSQTDDTNVQIHRQQ